jgi:histidine triad (HIT) family protein
MVTKRIVSQASYLLSRFHLGISVILWSLNHMSFILPINRLSESVNLIAFHHPQPSHPTHIVIVPKRPISSLMELSPKDSSLLSEVIQTAQGLVNELGLQDEGYRLIVNGGKYQKLAQLHFHLISDVDMKSG